MSVRDARDGNVARTHLLMTVVILDLRHVLPADLRVLLVLQVDVEHSRFGENWCWRLTDARGSIRGLMAVKACGHYLF